MTTHIIKSPIGNISFCVDKDVVEGIDFGIQGKVTPINGVFARSVAYIIEAYFQNSGIEIDIPIKVEGTAFQQRVWLALRDIPVGETRSYGELAKMLKSSPRAVGNACRRNPLPIVIPCHRVVSAKGIGGFSGDTNGENIRIKRWLLSHEGVIV